MYCFSCCRYVSSVNVRERKKGREREKLINR